MERKDVFLVLRQISQLQDTFFALVGDPVVTWHGDTPTIEGVLNIKMEHVVNGDMESYFSMLSDALVGNELLQNITDRVIGATAEGELLILVTGDASALDKEDLEHLMGVTEGEKEKRSAIDHPYTHRWVVEHRPHDDIMAAAPVAGFETDDIDELEKGMIGSITSNSGCLRLIDRYGPQRWMYNETDVVFAIETLRAEKQPGGKT